VYYTTSISLVEEVETDAVLASLHHVAVERRGVPAVAALSLVGLLPQRGQRLPQAVLRRGAGAAVDRLVGVGGGVERVVVPVRAARLLQAAGGQRRRGGGGQRGGGGLLGGGRRRRRVRVLVVVDGVVVMVCRHLLRNVRGYGSAGGPGLTLGSCCGGRTRACGRGVLEGSLRGARPDARLLLVDQLPVQRAAVGAVAHVHGAVAGRLDGEERQMGASETVVLALGARGAAPTVAAAPSLGVPAVLTPSDTTAGAPVLRVRAAGRPIEGQRGRRHAVVHVQGDVAVRGGGAVAVHTEASSGCPGSSSHTSLGGGVAAAAPHTLPKVFTQASTLPAALLGVIAARAAGEGIVYGVS